MLEIDLYPRINGKTLGLCASVHQDGSCDKVCSVASSGSCSSPSDNKMRIILTIDQPKSTRWICVLTTPDQEVEYLYKDIVVGKLYDKPVIYVNKAKIRKYQYINLTFRIKIGL